MKNSVVVLFLLVAIINAAEAEAGGAAAMLEKRRQAQEQAKQQELYQQAVMMKAQEEALLQEALVQPADSSEVRDVVDITELFASLDQSSQAWTLIIDQEVKVLTVSRYIDLFRQERVVIKKSPLYYAKLIDGMSAESPQMLSLPFKDVLQTVAIIEYDFENGQDKDTMAKKILGEKEFFNNKKRLGL